MKTIRGGFAFVIIFGLLAGSLAGCAQPVTTVGIASPDALPKASFKAYLFSAGIGSRFRAVLLKNPESDIEIVPFSVQITTAPSITVDHAIAFMNQAGGYKTIYYQGVVYKGKTVGYLLTHGSFIFSRDAYEADLSERGGKVYFSMKQTNPEY